MRGLLAAVLLLTGCVSMVEHRTKDDVDLLVASKNPRLVNDGLCIAAANGWLEQVTRALRKSADANAVCSEGEPPLAYALKNGRADVVYLLFEKGFDRVALQKPSALLGGKSPFAYCESSCSPEVAAQVRGAEALKVAAPATSGGTVALVVGIEDYQSGPKALYALDDARAVRRRLEEERVRQDDIVLLEGPRATRELLARYVERWLHANVKPGTDLFFFFAGNGAPDPKTGEAYLMPWDGDARFPAGTGYPLKKLYEELARTKARRVTVVLDAAFSGAKGRSALATGARPRAVNVAPPPELADRVNARWAETGTAGAPIDYRKNRGLLTERVLEAPLTGN